MDAIRVRVLAQWRVVKIKVKMERGAWTYIMF